MLFFSADGREEKIVTLEKTPLQIVNELVNVITPKDTLIDIDIEQLQVNQEK